METFDPHNVWNTSYTHTYSVHVRDTDVDMLSVCCRKGWSGSAGTFPPGGNDWPEFEFNLESVLLLQDPVFCVVMYLSAGTRSPVRKMANDKHQLGFLLMGCSSIVFICREAFIGQVFTLMISSGHWWWQFTGVFGNKQVSFRTISASLCMSCESLDSLNEYAVHHDEH